MLLLVLLPRAARPSQLVYAAAALILTISLACNFGYVLNEIYDIDQDTLAGRTNAAKESSPTWLWFVACTCFVGSLGLASWTTGVRGAGLTLGALLFPILYSVPPIRLKERKVLGVVADAAAAHVFPAMLCLLLLMRFDAPPQTVVGLLVFVWSLSVGLRGILTHQLLDEERDRTSGLQTVVHQYGRDAITRCVLSVLVPVELSTLIMIFIFSHPGPVFTAIVTLYSIYEGLKLLAGWKILLFERAERPYLPFLNGGFYEVWGPLAAALQLAVTNLVLSPLPVGVALLFHRRMVVEFKMTKALASDISRKLGRS